MPDYGLGLQVKVLKPLGLRILVRCVGFLVSGSGFRVQGSRASVLGRGAPPPCGTCLGVWVQGVPFHCSSSGLRVSGFGFRIAALLHSGAVALSRVPNSFFGQAKFGSSAFQALLHSQDRPSTATSRNQLRVSGLRFGIPIQFVGFRVSGSRLRVAGCGLRVAGFGVFRVSDFGYQSAAWSTVLQAAARGSA